MNATEFDHGSPCSFNAGSSTVLAATSDVPAGAAATATVKPNAKAEMLDLGKNMPDR